MARAARKQIRKTPARKAPIRKTAKRVPPLPGKFQAMVANLNVSDLDALIKAATDRKNDQLAGARASFLDEVKARAASLGISLMDLVGQGPAKATAGKAKADGARKAPAAKYRGPNGEIWSGRGRPARWLTDLEATGRKREEFAV
jgi:DNA-binding protein H-NS